MNKYSRKTVSIDFLIEHSNRMLKTSTSKDYRLAVIDLLESVLLTHNRYKGFRYLTHDEVPDQEKPGIKYINKAISFESTDSTRRFYF